MALLQSIGRRMATPIQEPSLFHQVQLAGLKQKESAPDLVQVRIPFPSNIST
jgi:hypothetical protein